MSHKLNNGAVFQYTDTKRGKAAYPPRTTHTHTVLQLAVSSYDTGLKDCVEVVTGIRTNQDGFSIFCAFRNNKNHVSKYLPTADPCYLSQSSQRVSMCVSKCVYLCMIVLHRAMIQRGKKICKAKRGTLRMVCQLLYDLNVYEWRVIHTRCVKHR